ncbi:MAG: hypothetical protein AAGI54_11100 [Planctomycetota bacterium]
MTPTYRTTRGLPDHPGLLALLVGLCVGLLSGVPVVAQTGDLGLGRLGSWHTDPVECSKQAAATRRDVLILYSRQRDGRLLADELGAGLSEAGDALSQFELCLLEYPEKSFQDQSASSWYMAWANRYDLQSIPAIILLDQHGRAYAQLAVDQVDPSEWPAWVAEARDRRLSRDAAVLEAGEASGPDRARAYDRALDLVGIYRMSQYRGWVEEAFRLDADDELGLRTKYGPLLSESTIDEVIQGEVYPLVDAGHFTPARERIEALLTQIEWISVDQRQQLGAFAGQLMIQEGQVEAGTARLQAAIDLAPQSETAQKIRRAMEASRGDS